MMTFQSKSLISALALTGTLGLAAGSAQAGVLAGYWSFDDTLNDASGNANHGSVGAGTTSYDTSVPTAIGSGKSFDFGPGDSITVADSASLRFDQAMTLSYWIKGTPSELGGGGGFIGKAWGGGITGWQIQDGNGSGTRGRIVFLGNGGGLNFGPEYDASSAGDDVWNHVAYVTTITPADEISITLYFNGSLVTADDIGASATDLGLNNTSDLIFGGTLAGSLDDLALFNVALDADQVADLASGSSPLSIPEPGSLALMGLGGLLVARRRRG